MRIRGLAKAVKGLGLLEDQELLEHQARERYVDRVRVTGWNLDGGLKIVPRCRRVSSVSMRYA